MSNQIIKHMWTEEELWDGSHSGAYYTKKKMKMVFGKKRFSPPICLFSILYNKKSHFFDKNHFDFLRLLTKKSFFMSIENKNGFVQKNQKMTFSSILYKIKITL